jgi:hypothetical protein
MPTLHEWRHILARGVAEGLSVPERSYSFPCYPFFVPSLLELPCGVVQPGGPSGGDFTFDSPGDPDDAVTWCSFMARWTVWLFFAEPNSEAAAASLDDVVYRLHTGAVRACATDEWNPDGFVPVVHGSSQVLEVTYAERTVWATAVEITVPVS